MADLSGTLDQGSNASIESEDADELYQGKSAKEEDRTPKLTGIEARRTPDIGSQVPETGQEHTTAYSGHGTIIALHSLH